MSDLQNELASIYTETHPEYTRLLTIIQDERNESISGALVFKNYQLEVSQKFHQEELENVVNEMNQEKEALKDKMLIALEEKRRKLEFELASFEFNDQQNVINRLPNRKGRGSSLSNVKAAETSEKVLGRKRKNQNVAILNLGLKEHEIYDDISYFRRMGISGKRGFTKR